MTIDQTADGRHLPSKEQIVRQAYETIGQSRGGGKTAAMDAHMRAWTNKNPGATVAICSRDPAKTRIEKPAGSGKA